MDTKININLEKIFKGVFKHSVHDKENVALYRVIIANLDEEKVNVYFRGERQVEWPQPYTYRGHNYWVTVDFTEEDKERKDKNEFGEGRMIFGDGYVLPVYFVEELYKPGLCQRNNRLYGPTWQAKDEKA